MNLLPGNSRKVQNTGTCLTFPWGKVVLCSIAVGLLGSASLSRADSLSPANVSADELISKGDVYGAKFDATKALDCYLPALKLAPKNVDLLVRVARQYRHLMADATTKAEKLRLGTIALEYSYRAAELGPKDSDAQLSVAITCGKMLPFLSSKEQAKMSPVIKSSAERAIKLNARNDTAWHILGRWHQVVAQVGTVKRTVASLIYSELPPASNKEAVECFQQAIKLNPDRGMHYVELGRTYGNMEQYDDAKIYLKKGLAMPDTEKDDAEIKRKGREMLAKIP